MYSEEDDDEEFRDIGGLTYDDFVRICEELNPGSTGC